ncbi:MAG TPA: RdgB/HAM1 family non-canonical purine NTP pyrophosphatase [Pyrinomonadaceae bacterium]
MKLLIATRNPGKAKELQTLLRSLPEIRVASLLDYPGIESVAETGSSFQENAIEKAKAYSREAHLWAIADDSGLEVDALDGRPGVLSARYGGAWQTDDDRVRLLLTELSGIRREKRSARFLSCVVLANQNGEILNVSEGICEGSIATEARGHNGFGYDPIFVPAGYNLTFGELSSDIKDQISHRAKAFRLTKAFLVDYLDRA